MTYTTTNTAEVAPKPIIAHDLDTIISDVCRVFRVEVEEIKSHDKSYRLSYPRWIIWKILKSKGYNCSEIARTFNRDHTTILHALKNVDTDIKTVPYVNEAWQQVKHHFITRRKPLKFTEV